MPINGSTSTFPVTVDDWGQEVTNDTCQRLTAGRWNEIQDATYALERHTQYPLKSGNSLYPSDVNTTRPQQVYKTYTVTLTGASSEAFTASLSGFSAAEKSALGGTPLHPTNSMVLQVRKVAPTTALEDAVVCGLLGPLSDYSGDSGWQIQISNMRDQLGVYDVSAGTYIVTVVITR